MRRNMSLVNNQTRALWEQFMPARRRVNSIEGAPFYSVEIYPDLQYFRAFDPTIIFEKWAAMELEEGAAVPDGMELCTIPEGDYAVFLYRGKPSEVKDTYHYIFTVWLPSSGYQLDHRPHLAVMDERYKGEHPDSEEELWIPVRR